MRTERQLDLNQQLSLDVNNYWGGMGGGVVVRGGVGLFTNTKKRKKKCLPFWQYMRPLPFKTEHDLLCLFHVFVVAPPPPPPLVRESIRPDAVCGHAISNEIGLQEFVFFPSFLFPRQTSHACQVRGVVGGAVVVVMVVGSGWIPKGCN